MPTRACVCLHIYLVLPQGAAGGIDSVGGETLNQIVQSLKPDATVLVYGAMSGFTAQVDLISLLFNTITVKVCKLSAHVACSRSSTLQYVRSGIYIYRTCACTACAIASDAASTISMRTVVLQHTVVLQRTAMMLSGSVVCFCETQ
jgi:hypothetical protein